MTNDTQSHRRHALGTSECYKSALQKRIRAIAIAAGTISDGKPAASDATTADPTMGLMSALKASADRGMISASNKDM